MAAAADHIFTIDPLPAMPGAPVRGRIEGQPVESVMLLRLERSPAGTVVTRLGEDVPGEDGGFSLELPDSAPPTAAGRECAIAYALRVTPADHHQPRLLSDELAVGGRLQQAHLTETRPVHDRLIARYDARGFRIKLTDADLQGGGELNGRVHLCGRRQPAALEVTCRCVEAWRVNGRSRIANLRHPPLWNHSCIWQARLDLSWLDGQAWTPFGFRLPGQLPPAVEARSIAWRYEVEARRRVRLAPDEVAVATPIGFELAG